MCYILCFFFSSRRRHTRLTCDWSSDVCSSDLIARRDGAVVFGVTDRGPGIPPEISERVFDRFESHALGSEHRGAGLGLSIVRSFVELHGGTVKLDSAMGRGTTVTCIFPLRRAPQEAAAE